MKNLFKFLSIGLLTASLASCGSPKQEVTPLPSESADSATSGSVESIESSESSGSVEIQSSESSEPIISSDPVASSESIVSSEPVVSSESIVSSEPIISSEPVVSSESSESSSIEPAPAALTLDFSTIAESVTYNDASMNEAWGSEALTISNVSAVYAGAGIGGCHANEFGLIKMGTGKKQGTFTVTTSEPFAKVVVNCHAFYTPSEKYPNNDNKFDVNGTTVDAPFNATGAAEDLEFTLAEPATSWIFTSMNRVYVWSITWSN